MWIVALPSGKVVRKPDDALWSDLEKEAWVYIHEKHLTETGGTVFLTLAATKWEKARLRFRLEARFSEIEDRYFFEGAIDPSHAETIIDWKITETRS
jgi:hypothetical protein